MKNSWNREGVSPVIATILMVAITVVLTSVLYVMILGIGNTNTDIAAETPMGLVQQSRNTSALIIVVATAPHTSFIYGTEIAFTHDGVPGPANATVYHPNGSVAATYNDLVWNMLSNNDTSFSNGMLIKIEGVERVSHGDELTMSGIGYGLSRLIVN